MFSLTPSLIDVILVGIGVEFAVIAAWLRHKSRMDLLLPVGAFLISGGALMAGLRIALSGGPAAIIQGLMLVSFAGHIAALYFGYRAATPRR
ncbi:MAG: hypothetical protein AAFY37_14725 [Pseudomonadota bacterium]